MKKYKVFIALFGLILLFVSSTQSNAKTLYAIEEAPTYNGPSKDSGRFFFSPTAEKPLTLDKNQPYTVLDEKSDWVQVDVFGKAPWAEAKYLVESLPKENVQSMIKERLESFDQIQTTNNRKNIHAGVSQDGNKLTFLVTDLWNNLSRDMKETYVRDSFILFMSMGGARNIPEKPEDYIIEVRHKDSNRLLATWDSLWGFKLKE